MPGNGGEIGLAMRGLDRPAGQLDGASGAWLWDIPGERLYADARFAQLCGLDPEAAREGLPTSAFFSAVAPEDLMRVRIAVGGVMHGAEVFAREFRVAGEGGALRWVSARGRLETGEDGRPQRFTGLLSDITEQKRLQEQLRVAQTAGGVGSFEYVDGFGTVAVSEQFCRLLGLQPAESLPVRTVNSVAAPGEAPIISPAGTHGLQDGYAEFRIVKPDTGEERWVARRGEVMRDGEAGLRFVGVLYDVTEAKRAEAALRDLTRTLEERVEARTQERDRIWALSRDLFMVCDHAGRLRATNPAWGEVLHLSETELTGALFGDLLHPEDRERAREAFAEMIAGEALRDFDCRMRAADGEWRWINWSGAERGGEIFGTGRDISQRKQLEDQLRQSQKMEAVGQLTGGLAHDFNNMLTGIMGGMAIVRRRIAEGRLDDLERFIGAAESSAERAAALTHRLLAFSRRQSLDTRAVDVNALVASLEDLLRRTLGEQTRVDVLLDAGGWAAWSDANQLESALLNLAINARDAMPDGGVVTVETRNVTLTAEQAAAGGDPAPAGDYVRVSVSDTGQGMPPEVIARAFDPFFTTKPIGEGTGLGLSMVYGFVRQTGGRVVIQSTPGQGTTIELYLRRAHDGQLDGAAQRRDGLAAPRGRGETILVVEDDPSVRILVMEVLKDLGYSALEAPDAAVALPLLRERPIDLLITDVGLPGLNGRQLADRAQELRPGLRVLFMTAYAEQAAERSEFLGERMAMITKPFAIDMLAVRIREIMSS